MVDEDSPAILLDGLTFVDQPAAAGTHTYAAADEHQHESGDGLRGLP